MRKFLIVAIAALTAVALTTVALAQTPAATMKVTVKPRKAGTKTKPKNSSIELNIVNNNDKRTLSKLTITTPKTFKLSGKGLTKCDPANFEPNGAGPSACPKASKVGTGEAHALVGVTGNTPPLALTFDVTPIVTGANKMVFFLHGHELPIDVPSKATIKGRKLTINVPEQAQQPTTGTYAGLVSIDTVMKAKKGKHFLASTTGCKNKKQHFSTVLKFINNGATPAGNVTVTSNSKCSK